ncbi:MAG: acetyl-CoA carboxylase biotin carboxyl carrier protein [Roseitalea sp.]|jgi:acetyl-CoA carboxylase biotin carboxyl carrier protein|nr:acetyl-CoA carboxylase biotin carboxyl carrier protein [Roseitalea sp.]MBO6741344.1 acetyl-CoA carboxylase biotin carboxyl carrier protein [Roseitalea sp.]
MSDKKTAFDKQLVSDLAQILNETDLTEIEVEQGEMRIRVSREAPPQAFAHAAMPALAPATAPAAPAQPAATPAAASEPAAPAASHENAVPAPMVGTAYLAPAPDSDPFVKVGANVTEGETLLIIEAMKVMNQIAAPRTGTVTDILIEDGEPVEFGQPLLVIQ